MNREIERSPDEVSGSDRIRIQPGIFLCLDIQVPLDNISSLDCQFATLYIVAQPLFPFYLFRYIFTCPDQFMNISILIIFGYFGD